jgi:tetratricopeptide (TPR) repeat protein
MRSLRHYFTALLDACSPLKRVSSLMSKTIDLGSLAASMQNPDYYDAAIAIDEDIDRRFSKFDYLPAIRLKLASALLGKAGDLANRNKLDAAIATYEEVNRRFGQDKSSEMRDLVASALYFKGHTLWLLGQSDAAIARTGPGDAE